MKLALRDQVRRADRLRAEAQVRDRHRAGLLRVVDEIALGVVVGLVADDLDRVLVGADRAVGAQAVEHGADHVVRSRCRTSGRQSRLSVGHIVVDADGEMVLGPGLRQFVEDGLDHGRREFLGRQP